MHTSFIRPRKIARQALVLALPVLVTPAALAQFLHTGAGPYDYNDTANWNGGTINNSWSSSLTADQTVTFGANTTLSGSLSISNSSAFGHTFRGTGGDRTVTLGGNISLSGTGNSNTNTVTFGGAVSGEMLHLDLGGAHRTFSVGTNRTLELLNTLSGANNLTKIGTGVLKLTGTANTFTGGFSIGASSQSSGTVVVTKLADAGAASSIGAGSGNIGFGGTTTGTLRYVGAGDSTNRGLLIGGSGAIIDASGTGALKFTNTSGQVNGSTGSARTFTLAGSNTDDNTMSASFTNAGSGAVSLLKQGSGRWILAGNNTYTGATTIDEGTLQLGASDRISDSGNLVLNGGTFATGGFGETLATLDVNGNAVIDFGSGDSDLVFADSSGVAWGDSISLSIVNFTEGVDSIRFGATFEGVTGLQLGKITINGFAAAIDEQGFLSAAAVPEPSAFAALAGAAGLVAAGSRRRRRAA